MKFWVLATCKLRSPCEDDLIYGDDGRAGSSPRLREAQDSERLRRKRYID
jgi:hypothetical protein